MKKFPWSVLGKKFLPHVLFAYYMAYNIDATYTNSFIAQKVLV